MAKKTGMEWADEKARAIINGNKYMVLATAGKDGKPWGCVLNYVHDDEYNFYFLSSQKSEHMRQIKHEPVVFMVIYDSHCTKEEQDEVQIRGMARPVTQEELLNVIEKYDVSPYIKKHAVVEDFIGNSEVKFMRVTVLDAYTLDTRDEPGRRKRLHVKLA